MPDAATDKDGYLLLTADWTEAIASDLAASVGIELTQDHWHIINCAREFYTQHQLPPMMRPLLKSLRQQQPALANSIRVMQLFPGQGSPAKRIALIAGLPRPTNCI